MKTQQELKQDTRNFVIKALTEAAGKKPSKETINITVNRVIKAFKHINLSPESSNRQRF